MLKLQTWRHFQAEGKRSALMRRLKVGLAVGIGAGLIRGVVAPWLEPRPQRFASAVVEFLFIVLGCLIFYLVQFFLEWELLRRKFSESADKRGGKESL